MPVDSAAGSPLGATPYVGRRVALLERPESPERPEPATVAAIAAPSFGDDTMERVLGALEPVDQTTCFAHEDTERIPLGELRSEGAAPTFVELAREPRTATAGKRRAARPTTRRAPILRSLPSVPVLLGLATLALSVGGTLVVHDSSSGAPPAGLDAASLSPVAALTGSDVVGRDGRGSVLTRSASRRARTDEGAKQVAAANALTAQRTPALAAQDQKVDAYSKVLASNQWITPVTPGDYHLTARFGQYGLWATFHTGLDFAAPTGTPIHAIASGTVIGASYEGAYGNRTEVQLANGTILWYCHQNEFAVSIGDTVTQGQVIGYVGSTGHVTGPHVHIEVHPDGGDAVDPFPEFVAHGVTP